MHLTFDELIEAHLNDMYSLALHLTGAKECAEDLVQDLFVNLKPKQLNIRHVENPRAWLAQILYRLFVDQWRKEQRSPITFVSHTDKESHEYWIDTVADQSLGPDAILQMDQQQKKLIAAMSFLNENQKHLIVLHDIEGYTLTEIEKITGTPRGTVKSRLFRAREKLSDKLKNVAPSGVIHRGNRKERT